MNTKAKGEKGQLIVIGEFAKMEIPVLIPLSDNLPFDFAAMIDGKLKKIQVKSSEAKAPTGCSGSRHFNLYTSHWKKQTKKPYTEKDCDFIICLDQYSFAMYLLTPKEFVGKKNFTIRLSPSKNKQKKGVNLHDDFLLTKEKLIEWVGRDSNPRPCD